MTPTRAAMAVAAGAAAPGGGGGGSGPGGIAATLWLKADDLSLSDTDPVTAWADASGNGHDASTPGSDPVFQAAELNGLPAVQFDGSSQYLEIADHADLKLDGDSTVFLVLRQDATSTLAHLSKGPTGTAGAYLLKSTNGSVGLRLDRPFVETGVASTTALGVTNYRLVCVRVTGTTVEHRLNQAGNGSDTLAAGTPTTDPLQVGRWGTAYTSMHLCELALYNAALSDGDRDTVEAALAAKYGL